MRSKNPRTFIRETLAANREAVGDNLNDFWRNWVEDLLASGFPQHEVVESMGCVAMVQAAVAVGTGETASWLRRCADKFQLASDSGVEFPAAEPLKH